MRFRPENTGRSNAGYSMIEMLIVTAIIIILATIPVALLRRSREKVLEAQAVRSLGTMALAYENYWAQQGHEYPNYRSDGQRSEDIRYSTAEQLWDDLIAQNLLPKQYSGYAHNRRDLLARGYVLSILPVDYGGIPSSGPRNTYALAMIPYPGSPAKRGLAVVQGQRFSKSFPTAIPRKIGQLGVYSMTIYALPD